MKKILPNGMYIEGNEIDHIIADHRIIRIVLRNGVSFVGELHDKRPRPILNDDPQSVNYRWQILLSVERDINGPISGGI